MRTILQFEELWEIISSTITRHKTDANEQKKFDKVDNKALMLITLSISDEVQPYIQDATTSKAAWDALSTIFDAKSQTKILHSQSQLHTLLMSVGEKVADFLYRVSILRAELVALGEIVEDKMIIPITLRALPSKFWTFVTTLNITEQQVSFEELVNLLQQEEAIHSLHEEFEEKVLVSCRH